MAAMAQESDLSSITIETEEWGSIDDREITKFILKNQAQQEVHVITYGATVTAIKTPNKDKEIEDVVLGFDDINGIFIIKLLTYIKEYLIRCSFYQINFIVH